MVTISQLQTIPKTDHVRAKLEQIVSLFSSQELTNTVSIAMIKTKGKPCDRWSFTNKILMLVQGTADARGFRQWQEAGRHVKKGAHSIQILAPRFATFKIKNEETGLEEEERRAIGFYSIPVSRYEDTEGRELERYIPKTVPPLMDVAAKIGVSVEYDSLTGAYGAFSKKQNKIILSTEDPATFYHELVHAVQEHLFKDLKGGQDSEQEAIAELGACVLADLYGQDVKNNAWSYIAGYADGKSSEAVGRLCIKVLEKTYKILSFILDGSKTAYNQW
jgi:hypothetical protein